MLHRRLRGVPRRVGQGVEGFLKLTPTGKLIPANGRALLRSSARPVTGLTAGDGGGSALWGSRYFRSAPAWSA